MTTLIKTIIVILLISLFLSGFLPVVPYDGAWDSIFIGSSLLFFTGLTHLIIIKPLKERHATIDIFTSKDPILYIAIIIAPSSLIIGFGLAEAIFIPPGLLAKLTEETITTESSCIGTHKRTKRATSSSFLIDTGETWEVYGFKTCPTSTKKCTIEYSELLFSRYIKKIECGYRAQG